MAKLIEYGNINDVNFRICIENSQNKFSSIHALKVLRFFLFPFSLLYGGVTFIRNLAYDHGILKSYRIPVKSICVGNLSVGGTGKSPLVVFLTDYLKDGNKVHILSRGYGRKTRGYISLNETFSASEVGDEPLMYLKKFDSTVGVSVCESRANGVREIINTSKPDVILLDDAYQHRKVSAGFSILLTDFSNPFFNDYVLPAGNLREFRLGVRRADLVLVTKTPDKLKEEEKKVFKRKIRFKEDSIYFSSIQYGKLHPFSGHRIESIENVLLVTGIANPQPLKAFLEKLYYVEEIRFNDHHQFSLKDLEMIHKKFDIFAADKKIIVTTEKDYVRLISSELSTFILEKPWYYQEIAIQIDRQNEFLNRIEQYVRAI